MGDLEETFGSEFAQEFQSKVEERRKEREKVSKEVMRKICARAVNGDEFDGGDPMFSYETDKGITHDVMLMTLPDMGDNNSIWTYMNELDSGAVSIPLDYMGEWISTLFNERDMLKRMDEGESYLVVGDLGVWETDEGEQRDQMSPVRGVASLAEVKQHAEEELGEESDDWNEGGGQEEEAPDPGDLQDDGSEDDSEVDEDDVPEFAQEDADAAEDEEDDEGEDDDGGLSFGSGDDEEEEEAFTYEEVEEEVEKLGDKEEAVWEIEEGDSRHKKVAEVTAQKLDLLDADKETKKELLDTIWQVVEAHGEDDGEEEEEDEEDALF